MLERVWKSKSLLVPSEPKQQKKVQNLLPGEISSSILDLEMQCEKETISNQMIFDLVGYYTKAVQFYEERGDDKYKQYQKRMHKFLQKPLIQSILRGESGEMIMKKEKTEETVRNAENKAKQQVKQLIQTQEKKFQEQKHKVKEQIQKQEQSLEERIRRKRSMSNRSLSNNNETNNEESGKKDKMSFKLLLEGMNQRNNLKKVRKVYF